MTVYQVVISPNPILEQKAKPIEKINTGVHRVLDNMRDTLAATQGLGLAAPQIGISKRMIVIEMGDNVVELINPEIIYQEGEQLGTEGCLSVPGLVGQVRRAEKVIVKGLNRKGETVEYETKGLAARCFQHEIDHLEGILFTTKAIKTRRDSDKNIRGGI